VLPNSDDIDTKDIEIQNNLNTFLSEDLKVNVTEKVNDVTVPLITDSNINDVTKEKKK